MTSPRRFTSGPPELPGLIDASVWMKFSYVVIPTSDRPVALTTPTVTVWSSPTGNPFGLDQTVTVGGVSATGRSDGGSTRYESVIHEGAVIEPGNRGGPSGTVRVASTGSGWTRRSRAVS